MSDSAQVLAIAIPNAPTTTAEAAKLLAWLVAEGIVEAMPSDCGLGALAHGPGPNVASVLVKQEPGFSDFRTLMTNGMAIKSTLRCVLQVAGDRSPRFRCPSCNARVDVDDVWSLAEDAFIPPPDVECDACQKRSPVEALVVKGGAFGNLVLRFWNWPPLTDAFLATVAERCGGPVVRLWQRV